MGTIDRLQVTDFQSLAKADISLGKFTVIVGPSNSGKSALLRALKAVVRNVNSPSSVRAGKGAFTSAITFDKTTVSIERGKSQSTYRVILPDGSEDLFTKSGRAVPEEIQGLMKLPDPDGPDLTFSSQIDPPFLLSETGSTVAKVLGDLTNVSRLHAAAREANRRRLDASKTGEIRKRDAVAMAAQLHADFSDLPATAAALKDARASLEAVRGDAKTVETIEQYLDRIEVFEASESDLRTRLGELPEPADIEAEAERAGDLMAQRAALVDLLTDLSRYVQAEDSFVSEIEKMKVEEHELESAHQAALKEVGVCPTCNQKVA